MSNARPGPPRSGPHQSLTSAEPVSAWQMIIALEPSALRTPRVEYATGTFRRTSPDSSVKEGIVAIVCVGIKDAKGFEDCD